MRICHLIINVFQILVEMCFYLFFWILCVSIKCQNSYTWYHLRYRNMTLIQKQMSLVFYKSISIFPYQHHHTSNSSLHYCATLWCLINDWQQIEQFQWRAARFISNNYYAIPIVSKMLKQLGIGQDTITEDMIRVYCWCIKPPMDSFQCQNN